MAYLPQADGITLYSATIAATGGGTIIDTSGYGNIVFTFEGTAAFNARIEGSDDQTDWYTIVVNNLNDLSVTDLINVDGGYQFKTTYQYVRVNILNYSGTLTITALGRSGPGASSSDNLAAAFNPDTPIFISPAPDSIKRDDQNAIILSDSKVYECRGGVSGATTSPIYYFNARGYQSMIIHCVNLSTTVQQSMDGTNWQTQTLISTYNASKTTTVSGGIYAAPVLGNFVSVRVTGGSTVPAVTFIQFKAGPMTGYHFWNGVHEVNLAWLGSNGISTAPGVTAGMAVGGFIANGNKMTGAPNLTAGGDALGNVRVIYTDTSGRMVPSFLSAYDYPTGNVAQNLYTTESNNKIGLNSFNAYGNISSQWATVGAVRGTYLATAGLNVQDTSQYEGQSNPELLYQILQELRILNQQIYELPGTLATSVRGDAPEQLRQEPSIFIQ